MRPILSGRSGFSGPEGPEELTGSVPAAARRAGKNPASLAVAGRAAFWRQTEETGAFSQSPFEQIVAKLFCGVIDAFAK